MSDELPKIYTETRKIIGDMTVETKIISIVGKDLRETKEIYDQIKKE